MFTYMNAPEFMQCRPDRIPARKTECDVMEKSVEDIFNHVYKKYILNQGERIMSVQSLSHKQFSRHHAKRIFQSIRNC